MSRAALDRFETVAWVYDPSDLALLLSLFESEDIFVLSIGRGHAAADPPLATALGGVELRVHVEDGDDARLLLASLPPTPFRAPPLPVILLLLLLVLMSPPPRQTPCFVLNGTTAPQRERYGG